MRSLHATDSMIIYHDSSFNIEDQVNIINCQMSIVSADEYKYSISNTPGTSMETSPCGRPCFVTTAARVSWA